MALAIVRDGRGVGRGEGSEKRCGQISHGGNLLTLGASRLAMGRPPCFALARALHSAKGMPK
jgi:hypothetical protein